MRERFADFLIGGPAWLQGVVGVLFIVIGVAVFLIFGRLGFSEGGKVGGLLIGVGLVLLMLWANN
jgi:hypothetical protein